MTTTELISNCIKGDKKSQYTLVETHTNMLWTVCRRYARDHHSTQDALQESFVQIFKSLENYKHEGNFEAWMRTIAIRTTINYFKRKIQPSMNNRAEPLEFISEQPVAMTNLNVEDIMAIIATIPYGYQTVFTLSVIEGYSHKEIGVMLGITESTSRSQLTRAKKMLKSKIELMQSREESL